MPAKKTEKLIKFAVPIIHEVSGAFYVKARDKAHAIELARGAWEACGFDPLKIQGRCPETFWPGDEEEDEIEEVKEE